MSKKSHLEEHFALQVKARVLPPPEREYHFHPTRKWRFDFAWPKVKLAVEIQGGTWTGGAHGRGSGIQRNFEKGNAAAVLGWRVLQGDGAMIKNCDLITTLESAFATPEHPITMDRMNEMWEEAEENHLEQELWPTPHTFADWADFNPHPGYAGKAKFHRDPDGTGRWTYP